MNGEEIPPGRNEEQQSRYLSEPLRILYNNQKKLNDLAEKNKNIEDEMASLRLNLDSFERSTLNELESLVKNGLHHSTSKINGNSRYEFISEEDRKFLPTFIKDKIQNPVKEDVLIDFSNDENENTSTLSNNGNNKNGNVELSFEDNFVDFDQSKSTKEFSFI